MSLNKPRHSAFYLSFDGVDGRETKNLGAGECMHADLCEIVRKNLKKSNNVCVVISSLYPAHNTKIQLKSN